MLNPVRVINLHMSIGIPKLWRTLSALCKDSSLEWTHIFSFRDFKTHWLKIHESSANIHGEHNVQTRVVYSHSCLSKPKRAFGLNPPQQTVRGISEQMNSSLTRCDDPRIVINLNLTFSTDVSDVPYMHICLPLDFGKYYN